MATEPHGHRGHPTQLEKVRARRLTPRLNDAIARLEIAGFDHTSAVGFIAGAAWELGTQDGETWTNPANARFTVTSLSLGHAARTWSIGLIHRVLNDLEGAL